MKILISALLVSLLSACASTGPADPARREALAGMAQARAEGSFPLTERQFTFPDWPGPGHRTAAR